MKKIMVSLCLSFTCFVALADGKSNFIKLCHDGDRDANLIAERILDYEGLSKTQDFCTEAYKVLAFGETHLSCNIDYNLTHEFKPCPIEQQIHSIESLREFTLFEVDLSGNAITDLAPLNPTEIQRLNLSGNPIKHFDTLLNYSDLYSLEVAHNRFFNDVIVKKLFRRLRWMNYLDIENTSVTDISFIYDIPRLYGLNAGFNDIKDLSPIQNVYYAGLAGMKIKSLDQIAFNKNLKELNLNHNEITSIDGIIVKYPHLTNLWIGDNQLSSLEPLSVGSKAGYEPVLYAPNNKIGSVELFLSKNDYYTIYLQNNQLQDLTPIRYLDNLSTIHVKGNPVTYDTCKMQLQESPHQAMTCDELR